MSRRPLIAAGIAVLVAAGSAGCGPTPPQAPVPEAQKLDTSLSAISTACGLSYQSTALDTAARAGLAPIDDRATAAARKLISVYDRDPDWIYQGERVGVIAHQALSTVEQCGLPRAKLALVRALAKR